MHDSVANDAAKRRTRLFPPAEEPRSPFGARVRGAFDVSDERRRFGWVVTLTGAAVMAVGAVLMALSSI
jgi:hypothetical protein